MTGRWMRRRTAAMVLSVIVMMMAAGCGASKQQQGPMANAATGPTKVEPEQLSNTDPCAMQLHDLCGALLLYYSEHGNLPGKLGDLNPTPGIEPVLGLSCPASGKAYVYDPAGLKPPDGIGRLIVYDPTPAHLGMRWAIKIDPLRPGQPLVARVMALPESYFHGQGIK